MNYDIKILGDDVDNGSIEFDKLAALTRATKDIALKSLALLIYGYSGVTLSKEIKNALKIRAKDISGNAQTGTQLLLDTDRLVWLNALLLPDLFQPDLRHELEMLTPMALVIQTFRAALFEGPESNRLDAPLIHALLQFKKSFTNDREVFSLSNRGSIPGVVFRLEDFRKIEEIPSATPEPQKVTLTGKLDELKHSKSQLALLLDGRRVNVIPTKGKSLPDELPEFFGKDFTIQGLAHYRPGGTLSYVEMQEFSAPSAADMYFARIPDAMSVRQQVLFQAKKVSKGQQLLANLAGQWPGDETDAEFEQILKEVR